MPEQKTSGQPMDTYAGGPGFAGSMGGNKPPASAQDAVPLTGEKEAHGLARYGVTDWAGQITDTGKHHGGASPSTDPNDAIMDTSGPH